MCQTQGHTSWGQPYPARLASWRGHQQGRSPPTPGPRPHGPGPRFPPGALHSTDSPPKTGPSVSFRPPHSLSGLHEILQVSAGRARGPPCPCLAGSGLTSLPFAHMRPRPCEVGAATPELQMWRWRLGRPRQIVTLGAENANQAHLTRKEETSRSETLTLNATSPSAWR